MTEQQDDSIQDAAAETPKKKKKNPPRPNDLFSTARAISLKLETFSYEEQLQTLSFVRTGIEAKYKAQVQKDTQERYAAMAAAAAPILVSQDDD